MTHWYAPAICAALMAAAAGAGEEPVPAAGDAAAAEPAYKVLFENGFYSQVLEYLERKVEQTDDTLWEEYQKYRAFSLVLLDQRDSATAVFRAVLDRNAAFSLDPIYTSPKLYEVYHQARRAWDAEHPPADSVSAHSGDTVAGPAGVVDTVRVVDTVVPDAVPRRADWYRVPLFLLPAGAGQFYNRQPAKGAVLLLAQAVALGVSIFTFVKRDDYYHPDYGWYEGNAGQYSRATTAYRVEFAVFGVGYLWSVVDAFVVDGRRARARRGAR